MDLEIVTVGNELLLGFTIDTNAADIARGLAGVGARVGRHVTVPDDEQAIGNAVAEALRRSAFVIVTGGLGPTSDDVTRGAIAQLFGRPLEIDATYLRQLEERFARLHPGPMPRSNRSQAEVPRGAVTIANPRGTAPGILLEGDLGTVVLLPGVPGEMRAMLDASVLPLVAARVQRAGQPSVIRSRTLRTTGMSESALADLLDPFPDELDGVTVAFLPDGFGVDLRVTAWSMGEEEAEIRLNRAVTALRSVLGDRCYGEERADLAALVLSQLRRTGMSLAVAESCTGGLLGARLTAVAGASEVFRGGVIAYADAVKIQMLNVSQQILEREGAVSEAVALAMVDGVTERFGADAAIAVTGIAGPAGGTGAKPVGTVWTAVRVGTERRVVHRVFPGSRDNVRRRSAQAALDLLRMLHTATGAPGAAP
jgi:nicotinamide-nucleotide amidase